MPPDNKPSRLAHTGRIATAVAAASLKRLFRRSAQDDRQLGEALFAELDGMKGLAMKVGQILSYLDGLPPEAQAVLARLQRGVEARPFSEMAPSVEAALGAPLSELFESFDQKAIAAASIGQVHRARVGGREVAVKIQYPDVAQGFASDTRQLRRIAGLASFASSVDGQGIVDELQARLLEECDYLAEARNQKQFALAFAAQPDVVVPEVVAERSARTVLTTLWQDGIDFRELCQSADGERRQAAARTLLRFAWHSFFGCQVLNADPHPGNYLFAPQAVAFLDYGCVRRFDDALVSSVRRLFECVLAGRRADFDDALVAVGLVPVRSKYDFDDHWRQARYELEPYLDSSFEFTSSYTEKAREFSRPTNPNLRRMAIPPAYIWLLRMQFGLHAVLQRLGAKGDFGAILRNELDSSERQSC